ncbi:MAG: hypothetical protein ACR2PA_07370 [Hyphomicrobiaceae bacterium]
MPHIQESQVEEILEQARKRQPKTITDFISICRPDANIGWRHEVLEAGKRYFIERQANVAN